MRKPRWLKVPEDNSISLERLNKLKNEWSEFLGLCTWGIDIVKEKDYNHCFVNFLSERYCQVHACNERALVHELLHVFFYRYSEKIKIISGRNPSHRELKLIKMDDEIRIFTLTNCLLRLKYGEKED